MTAALTETLSVAWKAIIEADERDLSYLQSAAVEVLKVNLAVIAVFAVLSGILTLVNKIIRFALSFFRQGPVVQAKTSPKLNENVQELSWWNSALMLELFVAALYYALRYIDVARDSYLGSVAENANDLDVFMERMIQLHIFDGSDIVEVWINRVLVLAMVVKVAMIAGSLGNILFKQSSSALQFVLSIADGAVFIFTAQFVATQLSPSESVLRTALERLKAEERNAFPWEKTELLLLHDERRSWHIIALIQAGLLVLLPIALAVGNQHSKSVVQQEDEPSGEVACDSANRVSHTAAERVQLSPVRSMKTSVIESPMLVAKNGPQVTTPKGAPVRLSFESPAKLDTTAAMSESAENLAVQNPARDALESLQGEIDSPQVKNDSPQATHSPRVAKAVGDSPPVTNAVSDSPSVTKAVGDLLQVVNQDTSILQVSESISVAQETSSVPALDEEFIQEKFERLAVSENNEAKIVTQDKTPPINDHNQTTNGKENKAQNILPATQSPVSINTNNGIVQKDSNTSQSTSMKKVEQNGTSATATIDAHSMPLATHSVSTPLAVQRGPKQQPNSATSRVATPQRLMSPRTPLSGAFRRPMIPTTPLGSGSKRSMTPRTMGSASRRVLTPRNMLDSASRRIRTPNGMTYTPSRSSTPGSTTNKSVFSPFKAGSVFSSPGQSVVTTPSSTRAIAGEFDEDSDDDHLCGPVGDVLEGLIEEPLAKLSLEDSTSSDEEDITEFEFRAEDKLLKDGLEPRSEEGNMLIGAAATAAAMFFFSQSRKLLK